MKTKNVRTEFENLCNSNELLKMAAFYCHDYNEQHDLAQETCRKVLEALPTFDESKASMKTWISRIMHNEFLDTIKKKRIRPFSEFESRYDEDGMRESFGASVRDYSETALDMLMNKEHAKIFSIYLGKLPVIEQQIIVMLVIEKQHGAKVSEKLGIPYEQLAQRKKRAIEHLKKLIERDGYL